MAISFECESCGMAFTVRDELAGKTGQCKQCGQRMTIPRESDSEGYGLEDSGPAPAPDPQASALPPRAFKPAPTSSPGRRPLFDSPSASKPKEKKGGFFSFGRNERGGLVGAAVVLVGLGLRVYFGWERANARNARNNQANAMAPQIEARQMVTHWQHPHQSDLALVSSPIKLSATPMRRDMPPPLLGQHTDEVLRSVLNYPNAKLSKLKNQKVI